MLTSDVGAALAARKAAETIVRRFVEENRISVGQVLALMVMQISGSAVICPGGVLPCIVKLTYFRVFGEL